MIEAMLWTMVEPLLATQCGAPPVPRGDQSDVYSPHGTYRCAGNDEWISVAVGSDGEWEALCGLVPDLTRLATLGQSERLAQRDAISAVLAVWFRTQPADTVAEQLRRAGIPAAALATSIALVDSEHLCARGFWDAHGSGVLPGLPWRASFERSVGLAPGLGADTDAVLSAVLGLSGAEIRALRCSGAVG
jgi:crotonobetainyl-CoA:carnitine CoA-transferase CaiB-like acyl-CoA transferase